MQLPRAFPPGLPFVLLSIWLLSIPLLSVYALTYFVTLPTWAFVLLEAISLPIFIVTRINLKWWREQRAAARLGAVFPPPAPGKNFANVDLLFMFQEIYKNGYMGDGLSDLFGLLGGTFNLRVLWDNNVLSSDANVIKTVLATDFNNFVKGENFNAFMNSVLGSGVFNADGEMWKFHRSMTRPFFSRDRISHFDIFEKHADEALNKMRERLREGIAVDFQDLICRFTLDSATEFLFGGCVNSLASDLPYPPTSPQAQKGRVVTPAEKFAQAFSKAQETIAYRGRLGWVWPWQEIFTNKTESDMQTVDAFINPILEKAVKNYEQSKAAGLYGKDSEEVKDDETFLENLVKTTTDHKVLHDEILNILIAGRDTTASTLTFAVYFLCMYPHILEKLRKEILETVGPERRPDYDDIKNMKYLRAFLNEVLRLYPAVPFNVRHAVQDTTIPNPDPHGSPFFVPKNCAVTYSVFHMHRRADYWGEDSHTFDPERFLDDRVKLLLANPFIFLPFNAGPRICLGQQFAYNEMSFFLIRLLQNFSFMTMHSECQDPATVPPKEWQQSPGRKGIEKFFPKSHLTAYAHGGMWVKMQEAEATESA